MNYKVGDHVLVKSLDWYNQNKNESGKVWTSDRQVVFDGCMSYLCGKVMTISYVGTNYYHMVEDLVGRGWTDEMIEGLAEDLLDKEIQEHKEHLLSLFPVTNKGYELFPNKDYEVKHEGEKFYLVKKKKEYPNTYDECAKILLDRASVRNDFGYKADLLVVLQKLLVCRDAYWKIAGEEMGLGKPWKPDWNHLSDKWVLFYTSNRVGLQVAQTRHSVFAFPTEEMRDAFYENFKSEIEICKELL